MIYKDETMLNEEDELYCEAVELIKKEKNCAAWFLQRKLKIGYARAAHLIDMMEGEGIVGPAKGAKPRDIL